MKSLKVALLLSTAILFLASCSKDDDSAPSINGLWKGKYSTGSTSYPSLGYAFLFRSNGTVRVFNNQDTSTGSKAEGTYAILGSTITCNYTYESGSSTYSTSAVVDDNFTFMEGTWGSGTSTTDGGRFFIVKQ